MTDLQRACKDLAETPGFSRSYCRRLRYNVSRWLRFGQPDRLDDISVLSFLEFRRRAIATLRPSSIETTVKDIARICRESGHRVNTGRALRIPPPNPIVPNVATVGRLYNHVATASWPNNRCHWLRCSPRQWWQAWIVTACWTAFRLADLRDLRWTEIKSGRRASKTEHVHQIAPSSTLDRHLRHLRRIGHDRVFGVVAITQMRHGLRQIAQAAKIEPITMQQLRRFGIGQWSAANAEAGRIVHGCGLGVLRWYLSAERVLATAAPSVVMPPEFLTPAERGRQRQDELVIVDALRRAGPADREILLRIAAKIL